MKTLLLLLALIATTTVAPRAWAAWTSNGVPICTAPGSQFASGMTTDGAGGTIIAWIDFRVPNSGAYAQRIDSTGAVKWAADGVALTAITANSGTYPSLVADGSGGALIFWNDGRGNQNLYGQHLNASGAALWDVDGQQVCSSTQSGYGAVAASDGGSGAVVAWTDQRTNTDTNIYTQHVDALGGGLWTAVSLGRVVCDAPGDQSRVVISPDGSVGAQGALVAWLDTRAAEADVYANRVDPAGTVQYGSTGTAVCTATGTQGPPVIAPVSGQSAVIAWHDERSGVYDIYAQKLHATGGIQWASNGAPVCLALGEQTFPVIASAGSGATIIVWQDGRSGVDLDIFAQKLDASGTRLWGSSGISLCTADGDQYSPSIIADGAGGVFVTWVDERYLGDPNLVAQHVDGAGSTLWPANGLSVCAVPGSQGQGALAPSNGPSVIMSWTDARTYPADIYAARLFAAGPLDVLDRRVDALRLECVSANPGYGEARFALHLARDAAVSADVFDLLGRKVRALQPATRLGAGRHDLRWDLTTDAGAPATSGLYFVRVRAGSEVRETKWVSLR